MKKTRRRVKGKIAGLCSTYIASLAGVAPVTVRRFTKNCPQPVTLEMLRSFIFEQEVRRISQELKKAAVWVDEEKLIELQRNMT